MQYFLPVTSSFTVLQHHNISCNCNLLKCWQRRPALSPECCWRFTTEFFNMFLSYGNSRFPNLLLQLQRQRNIIKPICTNRLRELLKIPCGFNSRTISSYFPSQDHRKQRLTPDDNHDQHELLQTESCEARRVTVVNSNNHMHWKLSFSQMYIFTKTKIKRLWSWERLTVQILLSCHTHHVQLWKDSCYFWSQHLSKAACSRAPHFSKLKGRNGWYLQNFQEPK